MRTCMSSSLRGACPAVPPQGGPFRSRLLCLVNRNRGGPITGPSRAGAWRRSASLPDDRFQMIEVAREGIAAGGSQATRRLLAAADELFVDGDEPCPLQFLKVDAQVAVGHLQRVAQL